MPFYQRNLEINLGFSHRGTHQSRTLHLKAIQLVQSTSFEFNSCSKCKQMLRDPSHLTDLGNTKHASDFSLTGAGVTNPCKAPSVCCELKLISHYWATGTVSRAISGSAAGRSSEILLRTTVAIKQPDYLSIKNMQQGYNNATCSLFPAAFAFH